jgi:molybdenum cofactor cytidylyltransferase
MSVASSRAAAPIGAIVLAAGEGRRFGAHKQLAELAGRPLLEHALASAAAASLRRVVVVLGSGAEEIAGAVDLHGAEPLVCERWREGMAEPLKTGIDAVSDLDAAVVLLGDQPLVGAAAIERVIGARRRGAIAVRATYGGEPSHPVLLERRLFADVAMLSGDAGARHLLAERADAVVEVFCDDVADPLDVDRPEDLRAAELRLDEHRR